MMSDKFDSLSNRWTKRLFFMCLFPLIVGMTLFPYANVRGDEAETTNAPMLQAIEEWVKSAEYISALVKAQWEVGHKDGTQNNICSAAMQFADAKIARSRYLGNSDEVLQLMEDKVEAATKLVRGFKMGYDMGKGTHYELSKVYIIQCDTKIEYYNEIGDTESVRTQMKERIERCETGIQGAEDLLARGELSIHQWSDAHQKLYEAKKALILLD